MRLRMAGATPVSRADGWIDLAEVEQWLEVDCRRIAAAFDARNGNGHYSSRLDGLTDQLAQQQPVELP